MLLAENAGPAVEACLLPGAGVQGDQWQMIAQLLRQEDYEGQEGSNGHHHAKEHMDVQREQMPCRHVATFEHVWQPTPGSNVGQWEVQAQCLTAA